jgi:hypothetical protein
MIDRHPIRKIIPDWSICHGDRYVSHPSLRTAMIQLMDEPETVYCISDETLPMSVEHARQIVYRWREAHETTPD